MTKAQYEAVAAKLTAKGYTAETVYPILEKANFKVSLDGTIYQVYASRVIAIMHKNNNDGTALEL